MIEALLVWGSNDSFSSYFPHTHFPWAIEVMAGGDHLIRLHSLTMSQTKQHTYLQGNYPYNYEYYIDNYL